MVREIGIFVVDGVIVRDRNKTCCLLSPSMCEFVDSLRAYNTFGPKPP